MTTHPALGRRWFTVTTSTGAVPDMVFCENETNNALLFDSQNASALTKDGIIDFVVHGDASAVSTTEGSKAAAQVCASLAAGETLTVTIRFAPIEHASPVDGADAVLARRKAEADAFYHDIAASDLTTDERLVQRQALAGLLGASSSTPTACGAGCRAIPVSRRLRARAGPAATATGNTWWSAT
jgi:hypothetical protein